MKKILGIFGLLVAVFALTWAIEPKFASAYNLQNIIRWTSLFGIISIGAAFVIITGGIDLSIGSLIGLVGCTLPLLLSAGYSPLSFNRGRMRSVAVRWPTSRPPHHPSPSAALCRHAVRPAAIPRLGSLDYTRSGAGLRLIIRATACAGHWKNCSFRWLLAPHPLPHLGRVGPGGSRLSQPHDLGRYLLALGRNEEAARYSGVPIERMKILAYIICSGTAGLGGILFALDVNSVQPAGQGNFYELYAIAAAVLGGCSLRGGEGSILGVIIGAAVMRVLYNAINVLAYPLS